MNRIVQRIAPPPSWRLPVLFLLGVLTGVAGVVIYVSNAASYLSETPETCMNCHLMAPQYATWQHGSHGRVATCNDCHVPHDNIVHKYLFKAQDGLRHAAIFTARAEPQVIHIKQAGRNAVQENCKRCHANLVHMVSITNVTGDTRDEGAGHLCWDCHREVPHGRVNSLASTPWARVPLPSSITPQWIHDYLQNNPTHTKH